MSDFLKKIRELTEIRVAEAKNTNPYPQASLRNPHDVIGKLRQKKNPRIIAEVKRSSPSRGAIALELDPVNIAREYIAEGAAIISVLTEPTYFGGSLETLANIRQAFPEAILLMKDFVIDEYQILQAKEVGADAVLLIISLLGEADFIKLFHATCKLGLTPLVEVHDEHEMEIALAIEAPVIGVNNRNLHTLKVDLEVSRRLSVMKTANAIFISESGIQSRSQIDELSALGYDAFLVGGSLMEKQKPGLALRKLLTPSLEIKICGLTNVEDALLAVSLGATMIGLIFSEKSSRQVDSLRAFEIVKALPTGIQAIGVFTSEVGVIDVVEANELQGVQFHDFEPSAVLLAQLKAKGVFTIRAFALDQSLNSKDIESSLCDLVLIDSPRSDKSHSLSVELFRKLRLKRDFMLAGGLSSENISNYMQELKPAGIDLASSIESSPGIKNHEKLKQFFSVIAHFQTGHL